MRPVTFSWRVRVGIGACGVKSRRADMPKMSWKIFFGWGIVSADIPIADDPSSSGIWM